MSNKPPRQLDFEQIKEIIPQRFPFVMIDRVIDIQPGVKAVAIKNLTGNEWFYQGHFPIKAFTPGVLISEAIGQAGIVFFHFSLPEKKRPRVYLLASLKIRFLEPALHVRVSGYVLACIDGSPLGFSARQRITHSLY